MSGPHVSADAPPPTRPSPWRWWVCGLLLLATTLNYMDRVALNQTAADIKTAFGLTNTDYSRLESGFVLAFGVGAVVAGVLVDRVGVRWTYPASVAGWSAAGFLTGFAGSYRELFACRVALGAFEAGNWPCGVRAVRQVMPPAERSFGVAVFHSGTGLGAMVTPAIVAACLAAAAAGTPNPWQLPFRVIGVVGLGWVALWLLTVPARVVDPANAVAGPADPPSGAREPFAAVFRGRKFWLLVVVVVGVNTTWQTFRVWLPLYLETQLGYSKAEMGWFTFAYYATADAGAWAVGLAVLVMTRAGVGLFRGRLLAFAAGTALVSASALLPFAGPAAAVPLVLITGFGALGLFAMYFALSQEVSGRHQGKVTGVLGFVNAVYLAGVYEVQGRISDACSNRYEWVLAAAGVPAVVALAAVYGFWPRDPSPADVRPHSP